MSEHEQTVERLDFRKPPPGYAIVRDVDGFLFVDADGQRHAAAMHNLGGDWRLDVAESRAWAHYKARNDPPGNVDRIMLDLGVDDWGFPAARWAWYERRLALVSPPDFGRVFLEGAQGPFWPRCLTWPDEQVASVEEVLRG